MKTIVPAKTGEFLITQKCNLNCTYCFEKCKSKKDIDFSRFVDALTSGKFIESPCTNFYIFGGEPLMNPDFYHKAVEMFDNNLALPEATRKEYIKSICENITTNGTLIFKEIEMLKKYSCTLQVSLDGPEDINDACRVDYSGKGHFNQIMDNLKLCRENGIHYSLHGALSRVNYPHYSEINRFFVEEELKRENSNFYKNPEWLLNHNYLQIVFEDEITDEDIDIFLSEVKKTVDMVLEDPILDMFSPRVRKEIAEGFLIRKGGVCSAGGTMFTYDDKFNVYPCHRLSTSVEDKESIKLTSLDGGSTWNWQTARVFQEAFSRRNMNSAMFVNNNFDGSIFAVNWCPATNWEVSGSTFHIPSKYSVLIAELNSYSRELADWYGLNLNNKKFK